MILLYTMQAMLGYGDDTEVKNIRMQLYKHSLMF